ncbi:DUF4845 domain-containing protein [Chromatium okenii]|jgi:hypothetical protein|uniref:DUF4845 domain-containing protein n=2 Tax=Chromatium okenii TaxID=61644 RepID=A0A2S7XP66_9GAMM|nr:DUF4845 domain-containing protein [Chromatium okenii]
MITGMKKSQRGMGMLGILFTIGLLAFFMTVLLKLGPLYADFWTLRSIMVEVSQQSATEGGARGISDMLGKRMDVNNIRSITINDFEIEKQDQNKFKVTLNYAQQAHLFFNVDAIVKFEYQVEVKTQ